MSYSIQRVEYYYTTIKDNPGEAYQFLENLANQGINLLAFAAIPTGPSTTQLTIFPEDARNLEDLAKKTGMTLVGPHAAFLVQGVDELGALANVHRLLFQANVNVYSSTGVTCGGGSYSYIVYVRHIDYDRAAAALGV